VTQRNPVLCNPENSWLTFFHCAVFLTVWLSLGRQRAEAAANPHLRWWDKTMGHTRFPTDTERALQRESVHHRLPVALLRGLSISYSSPETGGLDMGWDTNGRQKHKHTHTHTKDSHIKHTHTHTKDSHIKHTHTHTRTKPQTLTDKFPGLTDCLLLFSYLWLKRHRIRKRKQRQPLCA